MRRGLEKLLDLRVEGACLVEHSSIGIFNWGQVDNYVRRSGRALVIIPVVEPELEVISLAELRQMREETKARKEQLRERELRQRVFAGSEY